MAAPRTLLAVLVAAFAAIGASAGAPQYDEALWNSYSKYSAANIHSNLMFAGSGQQPLFPLDKGFDVEADCNSPNRPFPSASAERAPGACEYEPTGGFALVLVVAGWEGLSCSWWLAVASVSGSPLPSLLTPSSPSNAQQHPTTPIGDSTYRFWQKLPSDRLRLSNCYCYALNRFEGGFCMPGMGAGMGEPQPMAMTCADLSARVVADGGVRATREAAVTAPVPSIDGHYVAMFYRPAASCDFAHCTSDFHFLRRDASSVWSHKMGDAAVTNLDADNKQITDPQVGVGGGLGWLGDGVCVSNRRLGCAFGPSLSCCATHASARLNRNTRTPTTTTPQAARLNGGYTEFCGYFLVQPSKMKIGAQRGGDPISIGLQRWRNAGLEVKVAPLPYDKATDFVNEADKAKERLRMQRMQQGGPASAGRRLLRGARAAL